MRIKRTISGVKEEFVPGQPLSYEEAREMLLTEAGKTGFYDVKINRWRPCFVQMTNDKSKRMMLRYESILLPGLAKEKEPDSFVWVKEWPCDRFKVNEKEFAMDIG